MSDSRFVIAVFTPDSSLLTQCIGFNNNSSIAIITLLTASRHKMCIRDSVGAVFTAIFKGAFGLRAVGGGIVGSGVKLALTWGMKRGVFSLSLIHI